MVASHPVEHVFTRIANSVSRATGKPITFILCCLVVLVWAFSGPIFRFSDTWQLIINTGTTIITFLMVFLIQNTQNREGAALQAKLDELIRAIEDAENRYIGLEARDDSEIAEIRAAQVHAISNTITDMPDTRERDRREK